MPGSCNDQLQFQPLCSSAGYDATLRSREPGCDVRIKHPGESFLDRFNRQRRRHRLHGGTLPGRSLLQLRPTRHAVHNDLQRRRADSFHIVFLPRARQRRRQQPQPLFLSRHRFHDGRAIYDTAQRAHQPDSYGGFGHADQSRVDRFDRQRQRYRLHGGTLPGRGLHELRASRLAHHNDLQRHRSDFFHFVFLSRARHRRRRQSQLLFRDLDHQDVRPARYHATDCTNEPDSYGGFGHADQSRVDRFDRQRQRYRLHGGTLPGRGLHELRASRLAHHNDLQRHRSDFFHFVFLSRARHRRRRQSQLLFRDLDHQDVRPARYHATDCTNEPDSQRGLGHADQSCVDRFDRQRRRYRLHGGTLPGRGLDELRASRLAHHNDLQRHRSDFFHFVFLSRARHRRRRQSQLLFRDLDHQDVRPARYHATDCTNEPDSQRGFGHADQSFLDRFDRQRRCHRLHGRTLHGRGLLEFRTNRHAHCHDLQRHWPDRFYFLFLSRARHRRRRQLERLLQHGQRQHSCSAGHHSTDRTNKLDGDGCFSIADKPGVDRFDGQRWRDRLYGRTLHGRSLLKLRANIHADWHHLQ